MSLNIYDRDDDISNMNVVVRNDTFFNMNTTPRDTPEIREVLRKIEEGDYRDEESFIDRTGKIIPIEFLSSGSKTLINILENKNQCFDMSDCGNNAKSLALSLIKNGNAYFRSLGMIPTEFLDCDICYKGTNYNKVEDFLNAIDRRYKGIES